MSRLRFAASPVTLASAAVAQACPQPAAAVVTEAVPVAAPVVAVQSFAIPSVAVLATPTVVVEEVVRQRRVPRTERVRVRVFSR